MKSLVSLSSVSLVYLTTWTHAEVSSVPSVPSVSISTDNGVATLTWSGGRPSYQLQKRASFNEPWQNVGQPTTSTHAELPLTEMPSLFRVVADYTARFEVLFNATWGQQTHPGAWPSGAHWSGPVGGVHNDTIHFWKEGETASEGIRLLAERGQQSTFAAEIQAAMRAGKAYFTMSASGLGSPAQRVITFPQATSDDA